MRDRALTVIVGAGIVGASAAYHLAELGQADVLVIDRGPLFETGGSTSHAPGLAFQTNGSRTMCRIAQDSVRLWIGGEWIGAEDGATFRATSPSTGEVIAAVAEGSRADARRAISAATAAAPAWRSRGRRRSAPSRRSPRSGASRRRSTW